MPTGIVESIAIRRRSEESARIFVQVSFPVRDAGELLGKLANQLKNAADITFSNFQLALPEGDEDLEQPAADALPHKYMPGEDEGICDFCGASEHHSIHAVKVAEPPATETVRMTIDGVEADVEREPLSDAAQRLISDAQADAPPASEAEASEERHEARERLAHAGRR